MATRWRWPPESSLGLWVMRDAEVDHLEGLLAPRQPLVAGTPA